MAIIPDRDPVGAPNTRSRTRSRNNRIPLIGVLIAFVLGFGLVSLIMQGRPVTGAAPVPTPVAPITAPPSSSPVHPTP